MMGTLAKGTSHRILKGILSPVKRFIRVLAGYDHLTIASIIACIVVGRKVFDWVITAFRQPSMNDFCTVLQAAPYVCLQISRKIKTSSKLYAIIVEGGRQ
jgi:hypothetical protein